jgi:hypothetical protein
VLARIAVLRGLLIGQPLRLSPHHSGYLLSLLIAGASLVTACSGPPPTLTALEPPTGHPHEIVFVQGTERESAQIVWDAGTINEKIIPGGFQGAFMFSVPDEAMPGTTHAIALQNKGGRSKTVTFTIPSAPGPDNIPRPRGQPYVYPAPRIDAVTLVGAAFEPSGVYTTMYVQGANLDIGATISIMTSVTGPPSEIAATSHKVLRNDWYGVSHKDLAYPIYHYGSTIAVPGVLPAGQRIWLVATNLGGAQSEPFPYLLPTDASSLDSDGDNLPDTWETVGYDAEGDGVIDINLPALGASPQRRDLFVELDIMDTVAHRPDQDDKKMPDSTVFDALKRMFESAPIINYGDAAGIHLVIDEPGVPCLPDPAGGEQCSFTTTYFDMGNPGLTSEEPDPFVSNLVYFSRLKKHNFDNAKKGRVYHYAIWGIQQSNNASGISDDGDDFLITFDSRPLDYHTARSQIEAFAHEFGHNLRQLHAGDDPWPRYKPNYLSVMSYSWLFRTAWPNQVRLKRATCLPFYQATTGGYEGPFGELPSSVNTVVDYSEGMAQTLTRPAATGGSPSICGSNITWSTVETGYDTLRDFSNWRDLKFDGPAENGELVP